MDPLENLITTYWPIAFEFALKLLLSIVIFIIGKFVAGRIRSLISKGLQLRNVDPP